MKSIAVATLALFSLSAFACPNFTGEYFNEEFGTYYSINQESCDVIQYIYDEGVVESYIDGKEYLINEYDIVVEEGKVLANVKIYSSDEFKGNKLITKERAETTYTSSGEVEVDQGWSETYLNKTKDLITVSHGKDGIEKTIEKRVK